MSIFYSSLCLEFDMETALEKQIEQIMSSPGVDGLCIADSNGLSLAAKGTLDAGAGPLAAQLLQLGAQLDPSATSSPVVTLNGEHTKVVFAKHDDVIMASHING